MTKLKTHYYREYDEQIRVLFHKELGNNHEISIGKDIPEDIHVLILAYPTEEKIRRLADLEYLIIPFVGIPETTSALMRKFPHIKVLNIHHNSRAVAENVMALLLTGIKHIIPADREFRKHDWSFRYGENPSSLLYHKKILICGFGHIGKLLELFLLPYDVKIDKIKKFDIDNSQGIYSLNDLDNIIASYDIIINLLPATPATINIFNKKTFQAMKNNTYFINVGRASTVDEKDLFQALESKSIAGAALDVWYNYPKTIPERQYTQAANYPFHNLDNVIMSPHRAGGLGMQENEMFRITELVKLLQRIETEPDLKGIDLEIGY